MAQIYFAAPAQATPVDRQVLIHTAANLASFRLGTLYAATGQREQAHTELCTAIEMYQSMDMTFWLPQTAVALAQVEEQ